MLYLIVFFEKIILWNCEKISTLRPQLKIASENLVQVGEAGARSARKLFTAKMRQMARQHCNILINNGIQSLKRFERLAYVKLPSITGTSYRRTVRPFCFSNPTDIS